MTGETLVLDAGAVERALDMRECIDAIASTLSAHEEGRSRGPVSAGFALPHGSVHAKAAAAEDNGRLFVAVKANVNLPGNLERSRRPTIQGALILFDGDTGEPLAVMDSTVLTKVRTAAVAALAARHLALAASRVITIVGCGEQGEAQLRAMALVRNLSHAFVFDSDDARAETFAERISRELGFPVARAASLSAAVRMSDVCVTCTTSSLPLIFQDDLHPGLFVAGVGADNPAKQELDAAVMPAARVVVDSLGACAAGGDLHHAIKAGVISEADVHGELSGVVAGRIPGRVHDEEIFVFDSTGTALQDVAAAVLVYRRATGKP